jgi:hypothetical protein
VLNIFFLLTSFTSHTHYLLLDFLDFFRDRVDISLRSTNLERRLGSLEVASVVLGTYEREDDEVCGDTSDENALDKGVIRHVFWTIRSLNRRAEVFTTSYGTREMSKRDSIVEGRIPTGFNLSGG